MRIAVFNCLLGATLAAGILPMNGLMREEPAAKPTKKLTAEKAQLTLPKIKVGDLAPDFVLMDQNGKKVALHDFRGKKNVALAFYIFAFTGG